MRAHQARGAPELVPARDAALAVGVLLEAHRPQREQPREHLEHCRHKFLLHAEHAQHAAHLFVVLRVLPSTLRWLARAADQISILAGVGLDLIRLTLRARRAQHQLVVDVVCALIGRMLHHAGRLEEIRLNGGAEDGTLTRDDDLHELAEARRVLVKHGLGVAKRLEQRVSLHEQPPQLLRRLRALLGLQIL